MPEVSYNQSLRPDNYWGYGVIKTQTKPNLDNRPMYKDEYGVQKQPIWYDPKVKVHKNQNNYLQDFIEEPISKLNFEERLDYHTDIGLDKMEVDTNEDLDFDGDGVGDAEYGGGVVSNKKAEEYQETIEEAEHKCEPEQSLKEKSVVVKEVEKPIKENAQELQGQDKTRNYEKNQNDLKSVNGMKDTSIGDMLVMGAGAASIAMLLFGRNY